MSHEGLFSGGTENVMRWVSGAGIVLGLAAAGILIVVLARKPEWRGSAPAKWALLVGLLVLPGMTMLSGNVVGFHKVKNSCTQCHTMDPWVQDMKDPKSTTLVSKHYQNRWIPDDQCYTCHTGYGLAGNIQAKIGGLGHVTHEYLTGVPDVIKIHRPFNVDTCLHCHGESVKYLKIDQHVDAEMKPKILSGELSCFECHASPHPRKKP
ncbi:MAG TPA: NapC/NirT family cytochrome c [Planctomycetota bacterium]|nr:NapC/NirT family cytochrome c [Planctomycetota bacterium]